VTSPKDIGRITAEVVLGSREEEVLTNRVIHVKEDTVLYMESGGIVKRKDFRGDPTSRMAKYQIMSGEGRWFARDVKRHGILRGGCRNMFIHYRGNADHWHCLWPEYTLLMY
jgi:hypothetical protein